MSSKDLVVYLRPFTTDEEAPEPLSIPVFSFSRRKLSLKSYEELLKKATRSLGPFIAVGKPGDKLPPLGAARLYLDDADWQKTVTKILKRAQLVFIKLGTSEGLVWETKKLVKMLRPEQVIICLPMARWADHVDPGIYESCRQKSLAIFPCPLPEELEDGAQFIYFGPMWDPHVLVPRRSRQRISFPGEKQDLSRRFLAQALNGLNRHFALARTPLFLRHPMFWLIVALALFFLLLAITT